MERAEGRDTCDLGQHSFVNYLNNERDSPAFFQAVFPVGDTCEELFLVWSLESSPWSRTICVKITIRLFIAGAVRYASGTSKCSGGGAVNSADTPDTRSGTLVSVSDNRVYYSSLQNTVPARADIAESLRTRPQCLMSSDQIRLTSFQFHHITADVYCIHHQSQVSSVEYITVPARADIAESLRTRPQCLMNSDQIRLTYFHFHHITADVYCIHHQSQVSSVEYITVPTRADIAESLRTRPQCLMSSDQIRLTSFHFHHITADVYCIHHQSQVSSVIPARADIAESLRTRPQCLMNSDQIRLTSFHFHHITADVYCIHHQSQVSSVQYITVPARADIAESLRTRPQCLMSSDQIRLTSFHFHHITADAYCIHHQSQVSSVECLLYTSPEPSVECQYITVPARADIAESLRTRPQCLMSSDQIRLTSFHFHHITADVYCIHHQSQVSSVEYITVPARADIAESLRTRPQCLMSSDQIRLTSFHFHHITADVYCIHHQSQVSSVEYITVPARADIAESLRTRPQCLMSSDQIRLTSFHFHHITADVYCIHHQSQVSSVEYITVPARADIAESLRTRPQCLMSSDQIRLTYFHFHHITANVYCIHHQSQVSSVATPPAPLPSPLPHPPPPPRPPATTPQPMGEQQAPHLTRAMADERWRTVSWRMNKNLCLRRPVSDPGPLRMRDCRADHWTTETSCAWRRDMAVRAARGARR
ncbi:hypothetical protein J6590_091315 [Homalodisca vitripennis]|nr:hypothetical protein J6590_091315 [Homalodisca vitripennis]